MPSFVSAELVVHTCHDTLETTCCAPAVRRLGSARHALCYFAAVNVSIAHPGMQGASGAELKACCTEAGMFALRERRVHVTQEDFEMAVAKVMAKDTDKNMSIKKLWK